jgi:hypothetical protein
MLSNAASKISSCRPGTDPTRTLVMGIGRSRSRRHASEAARLLGDDRHERVVA